jgi:hypothetical protein
VCVCHFFFFIIVLHKLLTKERGGRVLDHEGGRRYQ